MFDGSVARLLYSKLREPLCIRDAGPRDFQKYAFNLLLGKIFKFEPGIPGGLKQATSFLNRFEISIHQGYPGVLSPGLIFRAGPMTNEFFSFVERTRDNVNGD